MFTYGGLDLNDGTTYFLLEPFDFGERIKTSSDYRGLDGVPAQYNVSEANIVPMQFRIEVHATTPASLRLAVDAINAKIDAGNQNLVYDGDGFSETFSCVHSPRVKYQRTIGSQVGCWTVIDLVLNRLPATSYTYDDGSDGYSM